MRPAINLVGRTFGRLTVRAREGSSSTPMCVRPSNMGMRYDATEFMQQGPTEVLAYDTAVPLAPRPR